MRTRRLVVVALALVLAGGIAVLVRGGGEPGKLSIGSGGSEGHPSCVYDAQRQTVDAMLVVKGKVPRAVTVTVAAFADENTSQPVGTGSRPVTRAGTVHVTFPVEKAPHVDEDGETACSLKVTR